MEFEAVDEGVISKILIPEGTGNVKVGTVIATITGEEGESAAGVASTGEEAPAKRTEVETPKAAERPAVTAKRSEEHTSELQSLMRISYAVFCLKKKKRIKKERTTQKK